MSVYTYTYAEHEGGIMSIDTVVEAHANTTRMDDHEVARRLINHLGATAVAALSGSKDAKAPYRWAKNGNPSAGASERLRAAHRVWQMLADGENEHTARAWFVGGNPLLGEQSPLLALREGKCTEVIKAATAFLEGTWSA